MNLFGELFGEYDGEFSIPGKVEVYNHTSDSDVMLIVPQEEIFFEGEWEAKSYLDENFVHQDVLNPTEVYNEGVCNEIFIRVLGDGKTIVVNKSILEAVTRETPDDVLKSGYCGNLL